MAPAAKPGQTLSPRRAERRTTPRQSRPRTASVAAVPESTRRTMDFWGAVRCGVSPGEGVRVSMGFNANSGNGALQRLGTEKDYPGGIF